MSRKYEYPPNWAEIARSIKERDGWRCAWCAVPHGAIIVRDKHDPAQWRLAEDVDYIDASEGMTKLVTVVLSVHHLGIDKPDGTPGDTNDKFDVRPENLVALCSRCHLVADVPHHIAHAKETRIAKRTEAARDAGQMEMFE